VFAPDHYAGQVQGLLAEAERLPASAARLALLEEAVRVADTHQDVGLGIEARRPLMSVARNLLRGDVLTAAFVWCLAQYDRDPRLFAGQTLFTEYRWVIGQLANLPDVARAKLEELLEDYGRRLEAAGYSRRHLFFARLQISPDLGDRALARQAIDGMRKHPRDGLSPDPPWELAEEIEIDLFLDRDEQALRRARLFLEDRYSQRYKSDAVCARLLLPLLRRGRAAEAAALQARCLRSYGPSPCYYWWFGELLKFSALTNDLGRAVRLYAECQRAITQFTDPLTRLHFALDAVVVFDRLAAAGRRDLPLRLPDSVAVPHDGDVYPVAGLREWLRREAGELAGRFDARNGNSYFRDRLGQRDGEATVR
jgi:hypothetical protein